MTEEKDIREMTVDTVGQDLLQALVTEIKLLPDLWIKLPKKKQDDIIDRLRSRVAHTVSMAVHLIASDNRTTVAAELDQITAKDGIKAVFKVSQGDVGRYDLLDSVGHRCLIVIADAESALVGIDELEGESDQRSMDFGREYTDIDGDGMDDDDVVNAEVRMLE